MPYAIYERGRGRTLGRDPASSPGVWRELGRDPALLHSGSPKKTGQRPD